MPLKATSAATFATVKQKSATAHTISVVVIILSSLYTVKKNHEKKTIKKIPNNATAPIAISWLIITNPMKHKKGYSEACHCAGDSD
jgi:hypothetical protein